MSKRSVAHLLLFGALSVVTFIGPARASDDDDDENGNDKEFCEEFHGAAFGLCNVFLQRTAMSPDSRRIPARSCGGISNVRLGGRRFRVRSLTPTFTPTNTPLLFTPTNTATAPAATATATDTPAAATATATGTAAATVTDTPAEAIATETDTPAAATATATTPQPVRS